MDETTEPRVEVYLITGPDEGHIEAVPVREAAAGMIHWARQELGIGTPACGVWEKRAIELLAEHGYQANGKRIKTGDKGND